MADTPFLSEIKIFSFPFAPQGWVQCNGQILPINQNQALFALVGTSYGGNGVQTFALPNLQGRAAVHIGSGYVQGQTGGEATHTLTTAEMPVHVHAVVASSNPPTAATPANNFWPSNSNFTPYASSVNESMGGALGISGNNQSHNNMPPYLTLNFCIAVQGIFPSRN